LYRKNLDAGLQRGALQLPLRRHNVFVGAQLLHLKLCGEYGLLRAAVQGVHLVAQLSDSKHSV
jgi:hypothetical protein